MNLNKFKRLKSPYVMLLIGAPLVGKSYFCDRFKTEIDENVVIINRDDILMDKYGSRNYTEAFRSVNETEVKRELNRQLCDASKHGRNVIVDMTHLYSKRRRVHLNYFSKEYYKLGVMFPHISEDEIRRRNAIRKEKENKFIPNHVIKNMMENYQPIRETEGFDKIISL